jgi:hypothetical protein
MVLSWVKCELYGEACYLGRMPNIHQARYGHKCVKIEQTFQISVGKDLEYYDSELEEEESNVCKSNVHKIENEKKTITKGKLFSNI